MCKMGNMRVDVREQIKLLAGRRGLLLKDLAEKLTQKTGKVYTGRSFTAKLRRGTLSYNEVLTICEILKYKITFSDDID